MNTQYNYASPNVRLLTREEEEVLEQKIGKGYNYPLSNERYVNDIFCEDEDDSYFHSDIMVVFDDNKTVIAATDNTFYCIYYPTRSIAKFAENWDECMKRTIKSKSVMAASQEWLEERENYVERLNEESPRVRKKKT